MAPTYDHLMSFTRRHFLGRAGPGLGALARKGLSDPAAAGGLLGSPHRPPRAKRVIYLFQAGGPSHLETFDPKPLLRQRHGQPLPKEIIGGQRLSTMSGNQSLLPMAGSFKEFSKHGRCGMEISDLLPHNQAIADDICLIRTMHARIAQAEMAFRMQTSVPEATDFSKESEETFRLYGPDAKTPGTYAANCLLARRLTDIAGQVVKEILG